MTTSIQGEQQKENQNPEEQNQNQGNESQNTNQSTNDSGNSNSDLLAQLNAMYSSISAGMGNNNSNNSSPSTNVQSMPNTQTQEPDYFANPAEYIKHQISQQVAPLASFAAQMKRDNDYNKLKNRFRNDPQFGGLFSQIEHIVDAEVDKLPVETPITEQLVRNYILNILGQVALLTRINGGQQNGTNFGAGNQNQANANNSGNSGNFNSGNASGGGNGNSSSSNVITPPHVAPRNPAPFSPAHSNYQLTEEDRAVAKKHGLTEDEYVTVLESGPDNFMRVIQEIRNKKNGGK